MTCLVLVLTGLGLSRSAVVCTQPCCAGHVKLVASCDAAADTATDLAAPREPRCCCCASEDRGAGDERGGERSDGTGCHGCVHIQLGVELAEPPAPSTQPHTTLPGRVDRLAHGGGAAVSTNRQRPHPPATGPPPHERRTAHRAAIQLLL
jgi:hypothetical protein